MLGIFLFFAIVFFFLLLPFAVIGSIAKMVQDKKKAKEKEARDIEMLELMRKQATKE